MRIYLAGPEVFLRDAVAIGAAKKAICARHGVTGVFPLDPPAPAAHVAPGPLEWQRIFAANKTHIHGCDALVANLTPFRGAGADPGTVYELGFMRGLGRAVHGYTHDPRPHRERVPGARFDGSLWRDEQGLEVEEFGLAENLMIEGAIAACGGLLLRAAVPLDWTDLSLFEAAIARIAGGGQLIAAE